MQLFTVSGFYGSLNSPTDIFCASDRNGGTWYVCEGAQTVNRTFDEITEGVNVEHLNDVDCFTWYEGINSIEELEMAINN